MPKITILQADITKIGVDAIVNAANSSLLGGGGVDGAIHRAGGPVILEECRIIRKKQGECPTGKAVITNAGNLPSKFVIHTVGPIWDASEEENCCTLLADCYENSLQLAVENGLSTIAFPNISTGIFGFPKNLAAPIAFQVVRAFFEECDAIKEVFFVCYDEENYQLYRMQKD